MPWIHLSDLKYWKTVASDVFNVNSISDNLLIDPEGTVVARFLRGEDLEAKLAEIFKYFFSWPGGFAGLFSGSLCKRLYYSGIFPIFAPEW